MYIQYFGLKENPFALPPDPRYLYLGERHQEALAHLMYGITEGGGFVQLSGEVGTGKTMMIRALFERLPETVDVALVLYPFLSVREFIATICDDLKIPHPEGESLKSMIDALNDWLLANHARGRRTVLVVDEAHKLPREVLEQIRLLTNLETTKEKLLQIILVGQPELNLLLARHDMRQLAQRVTARFNLRPLTADETVEYVSHRCRIAGSQMPLFSRWALRTIHRLSGGIPRVVNVVCDRALLGAYSLGKPRVNASLVRRAAREVKPELPPLPRQAWIAASIAAVAAVALGVTLWRSTLIEAAPAEAVPVAASADNDVVAAAPDAATVPVSSATAAPGTTPETPPAVSSSLDALLADDNVPTDTDTAFVRLFSYWQKDYAQFTGATGCDRAQHAGLRCLFESGTWNNLRQLNRPAIIELTDARGSRHHVLVSSLKENSVSIELGDRLREFSLAEVDRFWFGKYLALWSPPEGSEQVLRRGGRGPAVVWLRGALARAGLAAPAGRADVFDEALEAKVKEFQRQHRVDEDGIVGKMTLILLTAHDASAPTLLAQSDVTALR